MKMNVMKLYRKAIRHLIRKVNRITIERNYYRERVEKMF